MLNQILVDYTQQAVNHIFEAQATLSRTKESGEVEWAEFNSAVDDISAAIDILSSLRAALRAFRDI